MEVSEVSFRIIADLLEARTGQQLTRNRQWRIGTALAGVFREHGISNVDQLVCLLADPASGSLAQQVVEALLNNETYFYRDRSVFELLDRRILPALAEKRARSKRLSIWSAGCSTGQEALSLAMIFAGQPNKWDGWNIDIVGTDISEQAVKAAQQGVYTQFEIQRGLGVGQMISHFKETDRGWQASDKLKRMIRFKQKSILEPSTSIQRFDLVLCRNVLLYFGPRARMQAFDRLAEQMCDDGWLMLGAGETTVGRTDIFRPTAGNQGLFIRSSAADTMHIADPSTPFVRRRG
ncbi:protein-glutamate O-methyltransferase CheR [Altererythrobacter sp. RZ02]|uniref:protein-glutamate O-methyltransferase n=1 Tax=Pontixanthobacter rizhaonensis TaxID=2730337 RepID=A0A848QAV8_9SPHN|nr:protein-glutamate O-methyltransferase CheR [Pontixanthobacter rizhaonensis]NMW30621.1 protein-glutamate O-methyltransferase CheR [Pontixanthobacter rizhaonensis]